MRVIPEILSLPRAVPSAFAVQTCSSRKPLPTPPPLEYPIVYGAFAATAPEAPGLEQAAPTTATAASPTSNRARIDALVIRSPPSCDRRADLVAPPLLPTPRADGDRSMRSIGRTSCACRPSPSPLPRDAASDSPRVLSVCLLEQVV